MQNRVQVDGISRVKRGDLRATLGGGPRAGARITYPERAGRAAWAGSAFEDARASSTSTANSQPDPLSSRRVPEVIPRDAGGCESRPVSTRSALHHDLGDRGPHDHRAWR